MNLQKIFNSKYGVKSALLIARIMPPPLGNLLGNIIATWLFFRKGQPMVKAVRLNQWQVLRFSGAKINSRVLDRQVFRVFQHQAQSLYRYYHYVATKPDVRDRIHYTEKCAALISGLSQEPKSVFLISAHTSNFDLALYTIGLNGVDCQVLSFADPTGGYEIQNQLREESGLIVTPIGLTSLRMAAERLQNKGVVATGVDRPLPDSKYEITFFGEPAPLPTGHVRLALDNHAPIQLLFFYYNEKTRQYILDCSDEIWMKEYGTRKETIINNAQDIAYLLQDFILKNPHQWMMFYPVWEHLQNQVP